MQQFYMNHVLTLSVTTKTVQVQLTGRPDLVHNVSVSARKETAGCRQPGITAAVSGPVLRRWQPSWALQGRDSERLCLPGHLARTRQFGIARSRLARRAQNERLPPIHVQTVLVAPAQ